MRGRKPQLRPAPPHPEGDFAACRVEHYHLCGHPVYAQAFPHRGPWSRDTYYFHWFASRDPADQTPLQQCPACRGIIARTSIRLPGEQYLYEIAQELLELQLARDDEQGEDEEDAQTHPPAQ